MVLSPELCILQAVCRLGWCSGPEPGLGVQAGQRPGLGCLRQAVPLPAALPAGRTPLPAGGDAGGRHRQPAAAAQGRGRPAGVQRRRQPRQTVPVR